MVDGFADKNNVVEGAFLMFYPRGKQVNHGEMSRGEFPIGAAAKIALAVASIMLAAIPCAVAQEQAPPSPSAASQDEVKRELTLKITAPLTVAVVGDLIEPQPISSPNPAYQQLIDIIRDADVRFANEESTLVDVPNFSGPFGDIMATINVGPAIKAMGITIVNRANNHDFDGGLAGMLSTDAVLDKLDIVHAGSGKDLNEARAAKYLATPKGRVGLVGMVSFDDSSPFGQNFQNTEATYRGVGYTGGNPGVDALNLTTYHVVTPEQLETLRAIRKADYGSTKADRAADVSADHLKFFDEWYKAGPNPGALSYAMNPKDEEGILHSIRNGKILSDFMIATIHVHQTTTFASQGTGNGPDHMAPDFLIKLAHDSIDNGADLFVAHGVHDLRGVEIYKGKPIFYGLSAFILQRPLQYGVLDQMLDHPRTSLRGDAESEEALLATSRYEGGRLVEVRLYPVERGGSDRPVSQEGIPMTPSPELAQHILEELQTWSKPFGTVISIEKNVGVIHVSAGATSPSPAQ